MKNKTNKNNENKRKSLNDLKISKTAQKEIRCAANKELKKVENITLSEAEIVELVIIIKKYIICEKIYKDILKKCNKERNIDCDDKRITIDNRQVQGVLNKFAGYTFEKEDLSKIFGNQKINDQNTIKQLRDKLFHNINEEEIDEIIKRQKEFNEILDGFLNEIRKE